MEDNVHAQFQSIAEAKSRADNSEHSFLSRESERKIRFVLWFFGGLAAILVAVTGWVYGIQSSISSLDKRVTTNDAYRETTRLAIEADGQRLKTIEEVLKDWRDKMKQVDDMWQMKIRGESNKEAFFREHGYAAPLGLGEPIRQPPVIASSPTPTPR